MKGQPIGMIIMFIFVLIPVVINFLQLAHITRNYVVATSVEKMKSKEIILRVRRRMTTKKAVRCLKLLRMMKSSLARRCVCALLPALRWPSPLPSPLRALGPTCHCTANALVPAPCSLDLPDVFVRRRDGDGIKTKGNAREVYKDEKTYQKKKRDLKELFDLFDTDRSGQIDEEELMGVLKMMGYFKPEHGEPEKTMEEKKKICASIMDQLDSDHSKQIGFDEFFNFMALQDTSADDDEDVEKYAEGMFEMMDKDGEGTVSADEFLKTLVSLGEKQLTVDDIQAMIREIDKDGDGEINLEEFTEMVQKYVAALLAPLPVDDRIVLRLVSWCCRQCWWDWTVGLPRLPRTALRLFLMARLVLVQVQSACVLALSGTWARRKCSSVSATQADGHSAASAMPSLQPRATVGALSRDNAYMYT